MRFQNKLSVVVPLFFFLFIFSFLPIQFAEADTITVNITSDQYNTNSEECSLREAVQAANTNGNFDGCTRVPDGNGNADTIILPVVNNSPTVYSVTIRCGDSNDDEDTEFGNDNTCGDIDFLDQQSPTTVLGRDGGNIAGPDDVTVDGTCIMVNVGVPNQCNCSNAGNNLNRLFHIGPGGGSNDEDAIAVTVNMQGFTVQEGETRGNGGGMRINELSTANLDLMIFDMNVSQNRGGAIAAEGEDAGQAFLNVTRTRFSNNCSRGGRGGAVGVRATAAEIYKSEFFNNANNNQGSAITTEAVNDTNASTLIETTTFHDNATNNQGTIHNENDGATTTVRNSTIINNMTNAGSVAGVNNNDDNGVTLINTVVGPNFSNAGGTNVDNCSEDISSGGNNAISDNTCFGGNPCNSVVVGPDKINCTSAQLWPGGIPALGMSPANPARFFQPVAPSVLIGMGNVGICNGNGTTIFDGSMLLSEDQQCCPVPAGANVCDIGSVLAGLTFPGCLPQPPTGCCIVGDMCTETVDGNCEMFIEGASCTDDICNTEVPMGCCPATIGGPGCTITSEAECNNPGWQEGLMCNVQGTCGPLGCCQIGNSCSQTLQSDCQPPLQWFESNSCTSTGFCDNIQTGCCLTNNNQQCIVTVDGNCDTFIPGMDCEDSICMVEDPVGCCPDLQNPNNCTITTQSQCSVPIVEGLECNILGSCGPVGCCQRDTDDCAPTLQADCPQEVDWFEAVSCTQFGVCENLLTGCCIDSEDECTDAGNVNCDTFIPNETCDSDACDTEDPEGCCTDPAMGDSCFILPQSECNVEVEFGLTCNNQGSCGPLGCCQVGDECIGIMTEPECIAASGSWGEGLECGQGVCQAATGCCDLIDGEDPCVDGDEVTMTSCDELGGNFIVAESCNFEDRCGEPFISDGCCMIDDDCENTTNQECFDEGGDFSPGLSCNIDGLCDDEPETGCCVCGFEECTITTEIMCDDLGPDCVYQGDNVSCRNVDECENVPGCCIFDENGEEGIAGRVIDPDECEELTEIECEEAGGSFQGQGTQCTEFPDECEVPMRNVPTLSQWSMIAMAGLLGIFSLIVIARRNKMNLNLR